jgi:hypothetical protein
VPLHPSLDLLPIYFVASHLEYQLALVSLDELPLLTFSHDCLHLLRFDVFVLTPLADARSVLPQSVNAGVSASCHGLTARWSDGGAILSLEAILLFDMLLYLTQGHILLKVQCQYGLLVRLPVG